jgi:CMP-N,N'-diacetyllegionaminic acid synthase
MGNFQKMKTNRKALGLIPARHGSKGIIEKNTRTLCGKPLLLWTIEAAVGANCLSSVILSTDSISAMKMAKDFAIEVPFTRPSHLATDDAQTKDVVRHAIDFLKQANREFTDVVLLQPTSPARDASDIQKAWEVYVKTDANSLISVARSDRFASNFMYLSKQVGTNEFKYLEGVDDSSLKPIRRQETRPLWWRNGAIYIFDTQTFLNSDQILNEPILGFEMSWDKSVNIDDESDWQFAEYILSRSSDEKNKQFDGKA